MTADFPGESARASLKLVRPHVLDVIELDDFPGESARASLKLPEYLERMILSGRRDFPGESARASLKLLLPSPAPVQTAISRANRPGPH